MEARAKLWGHPIHQMLIAMPLGLLTGAIIFDAVHLIVGGDQWERFRWPTALAVAADFWFNRLRWRGALPYTVWVGSFLL